jgi:hypothetical protein
VAPIQTLSVGNSPHTHQPISVAQTMPE